MPNLPEVTAGQIIEAEAWNNVVKDLNPLTKVLEIVDPWETTHPTTNVKTKHSGGLLIAKQSAWDPDDATALYFGQKDLGCFIKANNDGFGSLTIGARFAATGIVISEGGDTRIGGAQPSRAKLEIDGGDDWLGHAWNKHLLLTGGKPAKDGNAATAGSPSITFTSQASETKFGIGFEHKNGPGKLHVFSTNNGPLLHNDGNGGGDFQSHLVVQEDGKVGIGIGKPDQKLEIAGQVLVNGNWAEGSDAVVSLGDTNHFIKSTHSKGVTIGTYGANDGNGTSPAIFLQEGGRVGIGTHDPQAKLEIASGGPKWTSRNWQKALKIGNGNAIHFDAGAGSRFGLGATSSGDSMYFFHTHSDGNEDAPDYKLILSRNGNLGVGTKTSGESRGTLHVNSIRPIIIKNNGSKGVYGSEIGFNAVLNTAVVPNKFIKLGDTAQVGGASVAVNSRGNMFFQMYDADTEAETITDYKPQIIFTNTGDAQKSGGGSWSSLSDKRLKTSIESFSDSLQKLTKLKPVSFEYNGKGGTIEGKTYYGLIAQEVQKVFPYMVGSYRGKLESTDEKEENLLTVDPSALIYVVINAIKELDKRLSKIESK